ncbi:ABC transporter substrate-binding protein [Lachnospiraceae bacterium C1.1]|nr:ABC transporter substrate-binding protein [Lachnospiraceae bacterium C1.1]
MKNMKKVFALGLTVAMTASMLAGCGGSTSTESAGTGSSAATESAAAASGDGASITIYNSKMEIQTQLEDAAKAYKDATGVSVEVFMQNDTVASDLATAYASGSPYTINMVDAKDIYSMAEEHALDLSGEKWIGDTTEAISIGDKVYGFPVCVEARGLIYNADAIKNITGEDFDPTQYKTLDSFKELIDKLKAGGMETPTGVMMEDWSLGAHYLAMVYEEREDTDAFLASLNDGSASIADDAKFTSLMDTFDVLKENNYASADPISADREVTEQKLAQGEIAFMFGGNWDWSVLSAYEPTENMGMMPVPQNTDDGTNEKLVGGGSKYFFIDSSDNTSADQQQAAKDFLNWLVYDEAGQAVLVNDCALVPAFSNITLDVSDPLGASVKSYADSGSLVANYNYLPDDHYSVLGGQAFQKYLAGQSDRAGFATEIDDYWKAATLSAH